MTPRRSEPEGRPARHAGREPAWTRLRDEALLDLPLRELDLRIEDTALETRLARLDAELARAGLRFRPHVWISVDWFSPDGIPGFAVPFYLAHPRLARLEHNMMLEVEGGTQEACMRLLRHETAHAIDNAYGLHRRKRWREVFGRFGSPYRDSYVPNPTSRSYVLNLDYWYAQSHPCEDFAETFAVWLDAGSRWRQHYAGWPALRKLAYVDEVMEEIASAPARVRSRARPEAVSRLRMTLREHYEEKQSRYRDDQETDFDEALERVFSATASRGESAARYLERTRRFLRRHVSAVTGQNQYLISQVMNELVLRCRARKLRRHHDERETLAMAASLLTLLTLAFVGRPTPSYRR